MSSALLSTPPRMSNSPRTTPAIPADVLAYLDDSDEERAAPSFFYQPEELDSPEKARPPVHSPVNTPDPTVAPVREARQFARVASVPARASNSPTPGEGSRLSKSSSHHHDASFEPETPASSNYLPRRPLTTASRPTFPSLTSKAQARSDFPSVTPGLPTRYQPTSLTSSKFLPASKRAGASGSVSTPESDGVLSSGKESSPDSIPSPPNTVLSPRISPPSSGLGSSTFTRPRVMAGRLGNLLGVHSVRTRKAGAMNVTDTSEEEQNGRDEESERERERDRRRASLEKRLEREREEREKWMVVDHDEPSAQDRPSDIGRQAQNRSPTIYEEPVEPQPMNRESSPTQREYNHVSTLRARSASSSDYHQPPQRVVSTIISEREYQRAVSSMDHYGSQPSVQKSQTRAPLSRPGTAMSNSTHNGDNGSSSTTISRTRVSRQTSEVISRPAPQPLSRQGSAPIASTSRAPQATAPTSSAVQRHRRTPTAPSPPTTSSKLRGLNAGDGSHYDIQQKENIAGVTWSSNGMPSGIEHEPEEMRLRELTNRETERATKEREKDEREKTIAQQRYALNTSQPTQVPQPPIQQQQQQPPQPPPAQQIAFDQSMPARKPNATITVHRKQYQRLECIGRGGSSRVYKVVSPDNAIYAIKRVSLENADQQTIESYKNEIALLKRLEGNKRIIRLIEFDSTSSKKNLLMVMECGEVDLAKLLVEKQGEPVDYPWVTSYWQQMLQAVHIIHEEKIVHSDLKPANFVLVKGSLKLIDFGIAKAIPNDTTNIQREQQIGTVNYMSPEAIQGTHGMTGARVMKLGRASDVWSLGCILYQMIYGNPPFYFLSVWQKMTAIPDSNYEIEFPAVSVPTILAPKDPQTGQTGPPQRLMELATPIPPTVIRTMRNCLLRDPKKRMSIPELMQEKWNMNVEPSSVPPRPETPSDLLRPDEAIIDDNMMLQLMTYTLANATRETSPSELREMIKGLRPALQAARKHRT